MAEATSTPTLTLCDVPYELLVYMASWLDVHDLLYRLPAVNHLMYTVANDRVTWARVVVKACDLVELVRITEKYGDTITIIDDFFGDDSGRVVANCPQLVALDVSDPQASFRFSPDFPPPEDPSLIQHLVCGMFCEDKEVYTGSLRSLEITDNRLCEETLGSCSRLTRLCVGGFFDVSNMSILPHLRSLRTNSKGLTTEKWDAFMAAHSANIQDFNLLLTYNHTAVRSSACEFAALKRLQLSYVSGMPRPMSDWAVQLVARNLSLYSLKLLQLAVEAPVAEEIAKMIRLRVLGVNQFAKTVDMSHIRPICDACPLRYADIRAPGVPDEIAQMLNVPLTLSCSERFAGNSFYLRVAEHAQKWSFSNFKLLEVDVQAIVTASPTITSLRLCLLRLDESAGLLGPALCQLREFHATFVDGVQHIAPALCGLGGLQRVSVSHSEERESAALLATLFGAGWTGHLEYLSVAPVREQGLESLLDAARHRGLRVKTGRLVISTDASEAASELANALQRESSLCGPTGLRWTQSA